MLMVRYLFALFVAVFVGLPHYSAQAEAVPPTEADFYQMVTVPLPEGIVLEVGGLVTLPNGNLAASTRRGEVYLIENPYLSGGRPAQFRRFAAGLHEILGLAYVDGDLYLAQRGELTRLVDEDGDQRADLYETVYAWPLSGHYHEYSFGPKVAPDGSMFVTGNVGFGSVEWWRGMSLAPWRGWTMQIFPATGEMKPYATGMRSPCGIGIIDGEFFYADNQGDWMGSGGLVHLERGDFTGHPAGLRWADRPESPVQVRTNDIYYRVNPRLARPGEKPVKPENIAAEIPTSLADVAAEVPGIKTPAVWLPHTILGISTSEIIVDTTGGAFGPFAGQVFIGDQGQSKIVRVFLEKVDGVYQGAAFNFREGFQSGVLRMTWGKDGSLFAGQTNRGWGSTGPDPYGLQRLVWTGRMPFEMKTVRARPDGFEIEFTQPVDKATAAEPDHYAITGFTYKYHPVYGSPIVNQQRCPVRYVAVSADGLRARLVVDSLRENYIHEIKPAGVRSYAGNWPLLHEAAYYTLKRIPAGDTLAIPTAWLNARQKAREAQERIAQLEAEKAALAAQLAEQEAANTPAHRHGSAVAAADPAPRRPAVPARTVSRRSGAGKNVTRQPAAWEKVDETLVMSTLPGLRYDRTLVTVKAGSKVKMTFYNNDDMPHNLVIVKPGTADAVAQQAMALGLQGPANYYVPASESVLYHTKLMNPGTSESLYFEVPDQPGDYTYVCTFPGHAQSMRGILRVVP
jgi:azurin/glucose/arabinose dehydrogenase